jgi:hypothetical protein
MQETLPASYFDFTAIGWQTIFTYFLQFFFGLMIRQDIWQPVFTARSPEIARWGSSSWWLACADTEALRGAHEDVGTAVDRVRSRRRGLTDRVYPRLGLDELAAWFWGLTSTDLRHTRRRHVRV